MKTIIYKSGFYNTFKNRNGRIMIIYGLSPDSDYFFIAPMDKKWQAKKLKKSEYNLIEKL